jgi:hypothetical protein
MEILGLAANQRLVRHNGRLLRGVFLDDAAGVFNVGLVRAFRRGGAGLYRLIDGEWTIVASREEMAGDGAGDSDAPVEPEYPTPTAPRAFEMVAYAGGILSSPFLDAGVVVDLDGVDTGKGSMPILYSHIADADFVLGRSDFATVADGRLIMRGTLFAVEATAKIFALADMGHEWQASIGARSLGALEFIGDGKIVEANGRSYEGPVYIARQTELREASMAVLVEDSGTMVSIEEAREPVAA